MTGNRFAKFGAAVLSVLVLFSSVQGLLPASASSISDLQQKQTKLKQQQTQVAEQIKTLKNNKEKQVQYKNALQSQISNVQQQIDNLNQQISDLDSQITQRETQIAGKQKDIDANYQKLKQRLYALYLTGEASNLEVVLNAKNIMDLADKAEIMQAITDHDTDLINTLKSEIESVKTQENQIRENRGAVAAARTEYDQKQNELSGLVAQTNQVIAQLSSSQSSAEAQSRQLAAQENAAEGAIDQWYKNYYASQHNSGSSSNSGGNSNGTAGRSNGGGSASAGGSGGYVSSGHFTWPVPSCTNITRPFGDRSVGGTFHKGIDISGPGVYGSPIVAADSGRVIQAGWGNYGSGYGGYGNVVAIDHGGGFSTLYGHMSGVAVSRGQQVSKGQVIGYVGSTGQSTGPHLHFEIRVNGSAVNPMSCF